MLNPMPRLFVLAGCEGDSANCAKFAPAHIVRVVPGVDRDDMSWGNDEPYLETEPPEGWEYVEESHFYRPKALCPACRKGDS